ncbi:MAG TPA: DUF3597 domain-containing protein [Anaerolineales bacterium]|nr:DUF3597 domain-containing protein [Anaerolineales bacterium]
MSFFKKILEKVGIGKQKAATPPPAAQPEAAKSAPSASAGAMSRMAKDDLLTREGVKDTPAAISQVDVVAKLNTLAKENPAKLDWKISIVDLLKLLDLDSSLDARKELAKELGCPEDLMGGDHAKMNTWLHKTVLQKIAENGGNIPSELFNK